MSYKFPVRSIRDVLAAFTAKPSSDRVAVHGWVRTVRMQKQVAFVLVADGSCAQGVQAVVTDPSLVKRISTGASVRLEGALVNSIGGNQKTELKVDNVTLLGAADPEQYPLHKAKLPLEHLRENLHLRTRTRTFTAMCKVRNAAFQGFHHFFQNQDFIHVNTPILTSNDCEGAGESFRVLSPESLTSYSTPPKQQPNNNNQQPHEFFGNPSNLTVSSQLHLESLNAALPRVYTLSPTFRAEKSLSTRHLAEFWMLEAEAAFITDLGQLMDLIEASIRGATDFLVKQSAEDLEVLKGFQDMNRKSSVGAGGGERGLPVNEALEMLGSGGKAFHRVSYTDALVILQKSGKSWVHPVDRWGVSLQSEHERFLAEEWFKGPVFVTDYPSEVKPFYMLDSRDSEGDRGVHGGETVACVDLLVPGIGEVVGGSLREHRLDRLEEKIREKGLGLEGLEWYLDLRRFGTVPHGGYGLGLERYLMAVSGLTNVRDVIPMPRWFGHCKY
ncbi:asparaginyl-tRNA synthetase [Rhizoclosmatium globosum]|uniref:asparagine--tRNA ligase n=1 Tax=Rhizoclosmatium globosum TaxID=329046 RepID=A0A1Y2CBT5_9FUNG|nr:asparaginyl-tRNA synthetase [Rhizoclosmatium globosum]|eukprot:ORY44492.1 asparaginyl-tRNA synthetase [Rhizoclosmatium globosum]